MFNIRKCDQPQLQLSNFMQKRRVRVFRISLLFFNLTCFKPSNLSIKVINLHITQSNVVCMILTTRHLYYAKRKLVALLRNFFGGVF